MSTVCKHVDNKCWYMSVNGIKRKVERLVNDHKSPYPTFFLSRETHLQSFLPIHPRGLDLFQAKSPVGWTRSLVCNHI